MLRPNFIKRKISLIQDDLVKLSSLKNYSFNDIVSDPIKQAAVERFLERTINRAIDINQHLIKELANEEISPPKDYKEAFLILADMGIYSKEFAQGISKSVGTRNILTHEYDKIDYSLICDSIAECLNDYQKYCDYILDFIARK